MKGDSRVIVYLDPFPIPIDSLVGINEQYLLQYLTLQAEILPRFSMRGDQEWFSLQIKSSDRRKRSTPETPPQLIRLMLRDL